MWSGILYIYVSISNSHSTSFLYHHFNLSDGIIDCTSKCAKDADKNVKKAGKKDSKKLKSCKASCDDDDKKCTKKCDKDEKKRISKEEDKAKKDALKKADKCTSRCVERGLFDEDVARVQSDTE